MQMIIPVIAGSALLLLTGCASVKPTLDQHSISLDHHDVVLARLSSELAALREYVAGSERHQDEALETLFERVGDTEELLIHHSEKLGRVQVHTDDKYWIVTPKATVPLP